MGNKEGRCIRHGIKRAIITPFPSYRGFISMKWTFVVLVVDEDLDLRTLKSYFF